MKTSIRLITASVLAFLVVADLQPACGQTAGNLDPAFNLSVSGTFVAAAAMQPDGKIVLGGLFSSVNGQPRGGIARLNQDGSVESTATFDPGTGISPSFNYVTSVAVQADGKILIGGPFTFVDSQPRNRIARLNANGTLESAATFNPGSGPNGDVYCMALQPDGKILLGGSFTTVNGQPRVAIARLNADGTVETTATFHPSFAEFDAVLSMAVLPDGKILLGGNFTHTPGEPPSLVVRLNADGTIDPTFAAFNPHLYSNTYVHSLAVQPDGKIVIVGTFYYLWNGGVRQTVARLNPDGSIESSPTFFTGAFPDPGAFYRVALQTDGKILLGGNQVSNATGATRNCVVRLNADGTLESAATFDAGTGPNQIVNELAIQETGKILLGGRFTSVNGAAHNRIARLLNDPATSALTIDGSTRVVWTRSGAAPEVSQVSFELSTDGGTSWSFLGFGTRVPNGWERTGLNLPAYGKIRARARTGNNSSGLIEQIAGFPVNTPVAIAGPDQIVNESSLVTLNGAGSFDPENDPLSFAWTQIAGPSVTLSLSNSANSTFTAPAVGAGGATLTFHLIVSDGLHDSAPATVNVTVKNVNHAPVAHAGSNQTVAEGIPVTLDGSTSFDSDGDALTYTWSQTGGTPVILSDAHAAQPGFTAPLISSTSVTLTFSLTVSDGMASSTASVSVEVDNMNHLPVANAGPDQVKNEGSLATLNGSLSSDPDADPLTYAWTQVAGPTVALANANTVAPSFTAPPVGPGGALLVLRLTVDDGFGGTASDEVSVAVANINDPPDCSLAHPSRAVLWPPNHKMVQIDIQGVADPNNDQITITVTSITQDEPTNGLGDGDTAVDAVVSGGQILLRAERSGKGNGRVYRINFTVTDGQGGTCDGSVTVSVPHSPNKAAVDSGQAYNSMQ